MTPDTLSSPSIELGHEQRRHRRHRVHLEVRFGSARDYVIEYAQNLSRGGVFIRGIFDVAQLQVLSLEIELPGFRRFSTKGQVVHIRSASDALAMGGKPGIGLQLVEVPADFETALRHYLKRLGHRREFAVMSTNPDVTELLSAAGYCAMPAPAPGRLSEIADLVSKPLLAVAVGRRLRAEYDRGDLGTSIVEIDFLSEVDEILSVLDGLMAKAIGSYRQVEKLALKRAQTH